MRFWNKKALRCSGWLPKISKGLWESDHFWPQFWPELEAEQMEIMELSGQKLRFFVKKRSKRGIYHLKNVKIRLRDQEAGCSNHLTPTRKKHAYACFFQWNPPLWQGKYGSGEWKDCIFLPGCHPIKIAGATGSPGDFFNQFFFRRKSDSSTSEMIPSISSTVPML